jgi:hypothetical protein
MASPTTKSTYETELAAKFALSGYNAFGFSNAQQAPLAGKAAMLALMDAAIAAANYDKAEELRRYKEDWKYGVDGLGITDADIVNSDTVTAMRAIITPYMPSGTNAAFVTQDHKTVVSA